MHLFGPIEGRRHDAFMLRVSGLCNKLCQVQKPNGEPFVIYGDSGYGLSVNNILAPFRGAHLTQEQKIFNTQMSKVRVCVEWGFGKICQNFAFLDFKKNQKVLLQPLAKYYAVAAILTKCLTSSYFDLSPPSLENYMFNQ